MMRIFVSGLLIMALCGSASANQCRGNERPPHAASIESTPETREIGEHMVFFKESRTGLCFGYYWGGVHGSPSLVRVPCCRVAPQVSGGMTF